MRLKLSAVLVLVVGMNLVGLAEEPQPAARPATTQAATGWVVEYDVLVEMQQIKRPPAHRRVSVQGNLMRIDQGTQISLITNGDTGEQLSLVHFVKGFTRASASKMKEANEQALKQLKRVSAAATSQPGSDDLASGQPLLKPTGKTEVINGYKAIEYVMPGPMGGTMHQWLTTELPDYLELAKALENANGNSPFVQQQRNRLGALPPGIPVRTVMEFPTSTNTTTLVSVARKSIPAEQFEPPAEYKQLNQ